MLKLHENIDRNLLGTFMLEDESGGLYQFDLEAMTLPFLKNVLGLDAANVAPNWRVLEGYRRTGNNPKGKRALRKMLKNVLALAKQRNIGIALEPVFAEQGIDSPIQSQSDLVAFYKKLGFKSIPKQRGMIKLPN